jgi:hypothetical protein
LLEYHGHLFLCTGVSESEWPVKIEQLSPLMNKLSSLLKKNRDTLGKIKLSATELAPSAVGATSEGCALYFAGGRSAVLAGLNIAAFDAQQAALLAYLQHGTAPTQHGLEVRELSYSHVLFVCAHVKVDKRCAYCGPSMTRVKH